MNYPGEEWKEIDLSEYNPKNRHWVSNFGRAKKTYRNKGNEIFVYNPPLGSDGYKVVIIKMIEGGSKTISLHRLIAEYFLAKKSIDKKFVLHLDYDKLNNNVTNLKLATKEENFKHCRKSNKWTEACKNNTFGAKLTESKVRVIKRLLHHPTRKTRIKVIANQFDISVSQVQRIKKGLRWKHVEI